LRQLEGVSRGVNFCFSSTLLSANYNLLTTEQHPTTMLSNYNSTEDSPRDFKL